MFNMYAYIRRAKQKGRKTIYIINKSLIKNKTNKIMKLKKFLAMAAVAVFGGVNSVSAANAITSGTSYYIQNVESGLFLGGGNSWGTQGTVSAQGNLFKVEVSDGKYILTDLEVNGKFGYNLYTDANTSQNDYKWTIDLVGGESDVFTIYGKGKSNNTANNFDGYLAQSTTSGSRIGYITEAVSSVTNSAKWRFLTKEEAIAQLKAVSWGDSKPASFLISDANFDRNHNQGVWTVSSDCTNYTMGTHKNNTNNNNFVAESYHSPFTISQTLTDIPNGVYGMTAQGFVRVDTGSGSGVATDVVFFMNDATQVFPEKTGSENSMGDASTSFVEGKYTIEEFRVTVTNNTLQLGMKNTANNLWCIWDNINLTYYGVDVTALQEALAAKITEAEAITGNMNAAVASALSTAIANAKAAPSTEDALNAALTAISPAIDNAKASAAQYADVAAKVSSLDADGQAAFAASESGVKYANNILAAGDDITTDYRAAVKVQRTPNSDFTALIINPNFDGNINGWTDTFTGKLNHGYQDNSTYGPINQFMECWAGKWSNAATPYLLPNGKLYQTVDLPAGEYTLSADVIATQQEVGQAGYIASLDEVTGIYIYAKSDVLFKSDACNAIGDAPKRYEFTFNTTGGSTDLGLLIENTNCNWAVMDNVRLVYNGESTINVVQEGLKQAVADAADLSGVDANTATKQAYANAVSTGATTAETNGLSDDEYKNAVDAITNTKAAVEASIEVYKEIVKVNEKAAQLKGAEAEAAYADVLATYTDKTATSVTPFETAYAAAKAVATGGYQIEGIDNVWVGQSGTVPEWACPDMPGAPERFAGAPFEGDVMTKTITGLKKGTYTVVIRGGASTTGARDDFEVLTGQNRAYLFANDALQSMEVYSRTTIEAGTVETATLTCGVKDDGVLKMGIQNKTKGANWFVVNLVSITYESDQLPTTDVELVVSEAQYSTFIAPFDAELPTGVKAYTVDGTNGNELVMAEQNNIQANTPVVLFSETPVNKILSGVSQAEAATYTVGLLTGVYAPVEITDGYVLQNLANGVKFYKVNAEKAITVPANRAYLTDSVASEGKAYFSFGIADDNTTAVSTVNALIEGKAEIYSVNGVKLQKLQKGINIVNGVPVMVK